MMTSDQLNKTTVFSNEKGNMLRTSLASPLVKQDYFDLSQKNNIRHTIGKPMEKRFTNTVDEVQNGPTCKIIMFKHC